MREITIKRAEQATEAVICARMMVATEPWVTLGRTYEAALEMMMDPERELYVAEEAGVIRGFVLLVMSGGIKEGYIQSLCVVPYLRGEGIGGRLLDFAEERIGRALPAVYLMVSSFNEGAQRLYGGRGYERVKVYKDYVVEGHDEILMCKRWE
ncbi:MAG TPA: GNAT family N-acetyltransferase [Anaerolineae bacterium]|nr:GNAT family N-acetyltransferase [Anaerolineae bacterium]